MKSVEPFADLQKAGAKVAYVSDRPVAPLDPFLALKFGVVGFRLSHSRASLNGHCSGRVSA
jgi:predicted amidohydrolase YtcJ